MNRKFLVTAICAGLFAAGSAFAESGNPAALGQAQDQTTNSNTTQQPSTPQETAGKEGEVKQLEAVSVTGSLLRRPEYQTTAPVQVINIEGGLASGAFDTADLLQSSAVASGSTQINGQFSGYIVDGGTGVKPIDLRGLGANRTLVLVDGQRPGPAGTRGAVGAFDLNVMPSVILGRVEIVKDGSSSIYGSDAISGVVNLITRKRMDGVEMKTAVSVPQHGGGEQVTASVGAGWEFDSGHAMVAAQVQQQYPLALKDRDYFRCPQDVAWGADGNRIDRADHSILQGTSLAGCSNLYANTIMRYADGFRTRYVPSRDGSTVGPFAGYHPRPVPTPRYDDGNPDGAYYEDVNNFPFAGDEWLINKNRNTSLYGSVNFNIGNVNWENSVLYNHRETSTRGFRQFFPYVLNPADGEIYAPIMPFTSNDTVKVDYVWASSKLSGMFESTDTWAWEINGNYSRSYGTYGHMGIDARKSADLTLDATESADLPINYFDPGILGGERMGELINAVGMRTEGNTTYNQLGFNAVFSGDLFELPAGAVSSAFGMEFRQTSIDDQPDANNAAGYEWGYSSAQTTKGKDNVREAFVEVGVPLLKGLPAIESLSLDMSGRVFRYNSVREWDNVWKTGLSWQVTRRIQLRSAPRLTEMSKTCCGVRKSKRFRGRWLSLSSIT